MTTRKRGRPKKVAEAKLSTFISVVFTKEEADQIYKKARAHRTDVSPWIRQQLTGLGIFDLSKNTKPSNP